MTEKTGGLVKLGHVGTIPIVNMLPTGAQVNGWGYLHLQLMGGSYVSGSIRGAVPINKGTTVQLALKAAPKEPSYSGSGKDYVKLDVKPLTETTFSLMAGDVEVCKGMIDPDYQIASSDEHPDAQQDDPDADDDDN